MIVLNVEKLLEKQGKTKTWLCDQMDISHFNLNQVIKGRTKSISFRYLQNFCKYLHCTFDELLTYIPDENDDD